VNGASVDPNTPAYEKAMDACRDLVPSGFTGNGRSSEQQDAALEFAKCVRDNGVPDFPDPVAGQPLIDTNKIPSAADDAGIARLDTAMKKCGTHSDEAGVKGSG
jgi:hypothetical protein